MNNLQETPIETQDEILINPENVPSHIYMVELSEMQKRMFMRGETISLEDMRLPDGRIVDGKVRIAKDEHGEVKMHFYEKKEIIKIPSHLGERALTDDEKRAIEDGRAFKFQAPSGAELLFQIDSERGEMMVTTDRDLNNMKEIGGYTLTEFERESWAKGEKLPARIFKDPKTGQYFKATIQLSEDGKGVIFTDYKDVQYSKAQEYIEKYNRDPLATDKVLSVMETVETEPTKQNEVVVSLPQLSIEEKKELLHSFVDTANPEKLSKLTQAGYTISPQELEQAILEKDLSKEQAKEVLKQVPIGEENKKEILAKTTPIQERDMVTLSHSNKYPYDVERITEDGKGIVVVNKVTGKKLEVGLMDIRPISPDQRKELSQTLSKVEEIKAKQTYQKLVLDYAKNPTEQKLELLKASNPPSYQNREVMDLLKQCPKGKRNEIVDIMKIESSKAKRLLHNINRNNIIRN